MIQLNEYQKKAMETAFFNQFKIDHMDMYYLSLGICGEAGEIADKVKKIFRDKGGKITSEDKRDIALEIGDVLWYLANFADYLGYDFSDIAEMNISKLKSRADRKALKGSGDNR